MNTLINKGGEHAHLNVKIPSYIIMIMYQVSLPEPCVVLHYSPFCTFSLRRKWMSDTLVIHNMQSNTSGFEQ